MVSFNNPRGPQFPVIISEPTFQQVVENINAEDQLHVVGVVAAAFPGSYFLCKFHVCQMFAVKPLYINNGCIVELL